MKDSLQAESEKLEKAWQQHEASWLRDYLVAGVEDPRINLQSILTRHFLVREVCGERFGPLMREEYKFSAAINWLRALAEGKAGREDFEAVQYAMGCGADNAEGIAIPGWVHGIHAALPAEANGCVIPNYIADYLNVGRAGETHSKWSAILNTFGRFWAAELGKETLSNRYSVLECACGSANDYRFLREYGVARLVDYTGLDLSKKNVENAFTLFPDARFEVGNVFEIQRPDKSVDYCIAQDLFEHLSLDGVTAAIEEVCRVTRRGLCVGFFQMDQIPEHVIRPIEEYHWNLLSLRRVRQAFADHGFAAQAIHIGTFLRQTTGCEHTHNPDAYTFVVTARSGV